MPVGEVNCQDRKNTMVARSWGAFSLTGLTWALGSVKIEVAKVLTFPPVFFLFARKLPFSPPGPDL